MPLQERVVFTPRAMQRALRDVVEEGNIGAKDGVVTVVWGGVVGLWV
jgi:hypothetical protein